MTKTEDGLAVVDEGTYVEVMKEYFSRLEIDPRATRVTDRIKQENPLIYHTLEIGMENAPSREAAFRLEAGIQLCYELLRTQTKSDSQK